MPQSHSTQSSWKIYILPQGDCSINWSPSIVARRFVKSTKSSDQQTLSAIRSASGITSPLAYKTYSTNPIRASKSVRDFKKWEQGSQREPTVLSKRPCFHYRTVSPKSLAVYQRVRNRVLIVLITGLSLATMDQQFQAKRRTTQARNRPKHAIGGISSGAKAFGTGILSGVEGLALKPLEGAEKEGVGGFLKGVGKGIAGYIFVPQISALTIVLRLSLSLEYLILRAMFPKVFVILLHCLIEIRLIDYVVPVSSPRMVSFGLIILSKVSFLLSVSDISADGQYALRQASDSKYFRDNYVFHLVQTCSLSRN
jgi:hypothetical protein